jgi:hypothetical protein
MSLKLPDVAYDVDMSGCVRKQWKELVLKGKLNTSKICTYLFTVLEATALSVFKALDSINKIIIVVHAASQ